MNIKLLTEHHFEFLSLKRGCTGSSESTLFKIPHCWKSHVAAQIDFLLSRCCECSSPIPHGAVVWSAVCDCGISCSYSLTFRSIPMLVITVTEKNTLPG